MDRGDIQTNKHEGKAGSKYAMNDSKLDNSHSQITRSDSQVIVLLGFIIQFVGKLYGILSYPILQSYKCQTFVSLPAWDTNSLSCTFSADASHARTLINVNPLSCPCLPVCVSNSLSCTRSACARKPRSHSYKYQPIFVSLRACLPASHFQWSVVFFRAPRVAWGEGGGEGGGGGEDRKKERDTNRERERKR